MFTACPKELVLVPNSVMTQPSLDSPLTSRGYKKKMVNVNQDPARTKILHFLLGRGAPTRPALHPCSLASLF